MIYSKNYDAGSKIAMMILDFSKAFDTVPHNSLLNKMKCYGVDGNINNWLHDFLIDGESSEPVSVDSGVPQLLGLGPLLFLCQMTSRTMTSQQSLQTTASCRASAGFFLLEPIFQPIGSRHSRAIFSARDQHV